MPEDFQIWYCDFDGNVTTYSSADGAAVDAPEWGVIAIATKSQPHLWDLHQNDFYCWYGNENTWRAHDLQGKTDYETNYPHQKKIINGRYVAVEKYNQIMGMVYGAMPPKKGWYPWEQQPPEA